MKSPEHDTERPTSEVGAEGGTDGAVELGRSRAPGVGSEAGETWSPAQPESTEVRRDESGQGKRSP